jgi:rod shape-determining protein MreC
VGVLVVLSLVMITISFRESPGGGLHNLQSVAAAGIHPFQVAAERVARPFRDVYGYFAGLVDAKSENERLREEVERLRQELIQNETARQENLLLRELYDFRAPPTYPLDYEYVGAAVVGYAPSQFQREVVISAGTSDGIRLDDPVVNADGLVGRITGVTARTARVTLLVDRSSAVTAIDLKTRAAGLVSAGSGGGLVLDRVDKRLLVRRGDEVITAGSQEGKLPSLYPRGIPIGRVTFVGQTDTDLFKRIQVEPYVDFESLDAVIVLVPKQEPAGAR